MTHTFSIYGSCALVLLCSAARAADDDTNTRGPAQATNEVAPRPEEAPARPTTAGAHASMDFVGPSYRSPGIAVALSLTPVPVDFGNLYAENLPWGIAYTTAEVALVTPMMWMLGSHMHDGNGGDRWSSAERGWEIGLVSGYVLVKIAAGIHAGYAAADFNKAQEHGAFARVLPTVATTPGGALFAATGSF